MSSKNRPDTRNSIRSRIQRRLIPVIVLSWLSAMALAAVHAFVEIDEAVSANLLNLNHATARVFQTRIDTNYPSNIPLEDLEDEDEFYLLVLGPDGSLIYASHPKLTLPVSEQDGPFQWNGWTMMQNHSAAGHLIIAGQFNEERDELLGSLILSTSLPMLLALGVLLFGVLVLVRNGLRPLQTLSDLLIRRDPQRLDALDVDHQPSELKPIVSALNGLFSRVTRFMERERKFIDDAAHELRTPLTIIKAQCQTFDTDDLNAENRQRLRNLIEGVDKATALSASLLAQARADRPMASQSTFDPEPLARQAIQDLTQSQGDLVAAADLHSITPLNITMSPEDLRLILRNLLENAALHGGRPAHVRLELSSEGTTGLIAVEDNGPGIPVDRHQQVFQRFFRSGRHQGTGLGLSIVRAAAERNGITVTITKGKTLNGARIELRIPQADNINR
ncbi:two-component system, OmpR family, sensor histidine kinase QseC [Thalassovita litoralis]|jgi:signal transduction histidine kinase|uniref:histidine kinase n=1 Tax=Thalassovita litoralis TaxID=1010611 RepID=A0A521CAI2_9RHOB|nr:ATP-binding protein [Thalassovita litoralis]SMO55821.1 two-component system, OmpR family, sensor histidine kinase QseC [Thalassovita litoralis]